jgi:ParB family chromosome partitioning protein
MQLIKKRSLFEASRVVYLPVAKIAPNPDMPRRDAPPGAMRELTGSVSRYGVLQPLSVRRCGNGYELISGERRLRAAQLAGLRDVPCIVMEVGEQESAALVLVENLQRRDLHYIEEARALARLRSMYGYSQEETARLVGRSQSAVANKLRLLKLPDAVLTTLRESGLTERHARSLLRLRGEREITSALTQMISSGMNVAKAEAYVEELLGNANPVKTAIEASPPAPVQAEPPPTAPQSRKIAGIKDVRFFLNTVERSVLLMRQNGVNITVSAEETGGEVVMTIHLPLGK